jgi:hypothetical protein
MTPCLTLPFKGDSPKMKRTLINRCVAMAIIVLPLLLASGSRVFAQNSNNKEVPVKELLRLPGRVLAETKSARPEGDLRLTGYRVEELKLPRTLNVEIRAQQVAVDRAWRVTVTGGPFPVRALPAVIWIDDQIVGNGIENEALSQVSAITFDSSLIREGGVVSISYGEDKETRVRVSQRVQLKGENQ